MTDRIGQYEKEVTAVMVGDILTLTLHGDVDHHSAAFLREITDEKIFSCRPHQVVLNLSRVTFMDSAGLGFILGRSRTAGQAGAAFCVADPTPRVQKILKLAGTEKLIRIITSEETEENTVCTKERTASIS